MNNEKVAKRTIQHISKLTLKATHELLNENMVGIFMPDMLIKFYYPVDKATDRVRNHLMKGIALTDEFKIIRKRLYQETNESPYFIHSLLAHWYLDDRITDVSEDGYYAIGSKHKVKPMTYVGARGKENIFFVTGVDEKSNKLRCIEVHKSLPITYRTVFLLPSQAVEAKRDIKGVSTLSIGELAGLKEPELSNRLMELEMSTSDNVKTNDGEITENEN